MAAKKQTAEEAERAAAKAQVERLAQLDIDETRYRMRNRQLLTKQDINERFKAEKATMGKTTGRLKFTQELADAVCRLIGRGWSLREIGEVDGLPSKPTIMRWLEDADDHDASEGLRLFRDQYARARMRYADAVFDETMELARRYDSLPPTSSREVAMLRLRIETAHRFVESMNPKKYGKQRDIEDGHIAVNVVVKSFLDLPATPPPDWKPRVLPDYSPSMITDDVEDAEIVDDDDI